MRFRSLIMIIFFVLVGGFVTLNWMELSRNTVLNLGVTTVEGPLLFAFLAWVMVSSLWANHGHVGDAAIVVVYISLFVLSWAAVARSHPRLLGRLLYWAGVGMALVGAAIAGIAYPLLFGTAETDHEADVVAAA